MELTPGLPLGRGTVHWPRPAGQADVCPLRLKAPAPAHQSLGPLEGKGRVDSHSIRGGSLASPGSPPKI